MDDIALVISELVEEGSESLNYNEVIAKSEIRMLHERGEILFHSITIASFHILMASYKFKCTSRTLFCCILLPNTDIHLLHKTMLVG